MSSIELLIPIIAILTGGAIILTPILALSARFALKPVIEAMARLKEAQVAGHDAVLQDRRMNLLETELQNVQNSVRRLADRDDFYRRLEGSSPPLQQTAPTEPPRADA